MRSTYYNYRLKYKFFSLSLKALACWPLSFFLFWTDWPIHYFPSTNSFMLHLCPDISPAWNYLHLIKPIQKQFKCHFLRNAFPDNPSQSCTRLLSCYSLLYQTVLFSSIWKYSVDIFTACLSQLACKLHEDKNSANLGHHCIPVPRTLPGMQKTVNN